MMAKRQIGGSVTPRANGTLMDCSRENSESKSSTSNATQVPSGVGFQRGFKPEHALVKGAGALQVSHWRAGVCNFGDSHIW